MRKMADEAQPYTRREMSREDAIAFFKEKGESYKVELMTDLPPEITTVSLYTIGEFTDLCRGPHLPHTGLVKAFKLLSVAGAYWPGDEKNRMPSRIYATAFAEQKEGGQYLQHIEEAKKRDQGKLGKVVALLPFHVAVGPDSTC